jgi:hypothetical protein
VLITSPAYKAPLFDRQVHIQVTILYISYTTASSNTASPLQDKTTRVTSQHSETLHQLPESIPPPPTTIHRSTASYLRWSIFPTSPAEPRLVTVKPKHVFGTSKYGRGHAQSDHLDQEVGSFLLPPCRFPYTLPYTTHHNHHNLHLALSYNGGHT